MRHTDGLTNIYSIFRDKLSLVKRAHTKEQVQRPRLCRSVFNLRKSPLGSANMVATKEENKKKKGKRETMTGC
jgi:hypothetical protein